MNKSILAAAIATGLMTPSLSAMDISHYGEIKESGNNNQSKPKKNKRGKFKKRNRGRK